MIDLSFDVWKNILLALAVAFVISFAATPVVSSFAKKVGAMVAERAKAKGIEEVVFDRGGYVYHGRVAALAEGAREAGLKF